VAGLGFIGALLVNAPLAGLIGLGLLGVGIANALPLAIAAGATRLGRRRRPPLRVSRHSATWARSWAPW
jgi:hypothetical protein